MEVGGERIRKLQSFLSTHLNQFVKTSKQNILSFQVTKPLIILYVNK
jgi:hypothetical protein